MVGNVNCAVCCIFSITYVNVCDENLTWMYDQSLNECARETSINVQRQFQWMCDGDLNECAAIWMYVWRLFFVQIEQHNLAGIRTCSPEGRWGQKLRDHRGFTYLFQLYGSTEWGGFWIPAHILLLYTGWLVFHQRRQALQTQNKALRTSSHRIARSDILSHQWDALNSCIWLLVVRRIPIPVSTHSHLSKTTPPCALLYDLLAGCDLL